MADDQRFASAGGGDAALRGGGRDGVLVRLGERRRALLLGRQPLRPARDRRRHPAAPTAAPVPGLRPRGALAAGGAHTCATADDAGGARALFCWGANGSGQLGNNSRPTRPTPTRIARRWRRRSPPAAPHTCAFAATRQLCCWGCGGSGQLGRPTRQSTWSSRPDGRGLGGPEGGDGVYAVAAGARTPASGATISASVLCFGANGDGQLGDGTISGRAAGPVPVALGDRPEALAAGDAHTCALDATAQVWCWGRGDRRPARRRHGPSRTDADGGRRSAQRPGGARRSPRARAHTCALAGRAGLVLGARHRRPAAAAPPRTPLLARRPVAALGGAVAIAAGGAPQLRDRRRRRRSRCWGANDSGQLGDGTTAPADVAVPRRRPDDVARSSAGGPQLVRAPHRRHGLVLGRRTRPGSSATASRWRQRVPAGRAHRLPVNAQRVAAGPRRCYCLPRWPTRRDQTLTRCSRRCRPGEQRGPRGAAGVGKRRRRPACPRARACRSSATSCTSGGAPTGCPVAGNAAVLDDGLVSGQHARIVARRRAASTSRTSAARTAPSSTTCAPRAGRGCATARWCSSATTSACSGWCRRSSSTRSRPSWSRRWARSPTASPALAVACDRLRRLAASEGELFIVGETGVGKEVYARAVHEASGRKGRFVAINCAAIPRELVESELFGYRAGAHSTAHQAKAGLIEEAEGGTLFLDEIGEMTPEAQIKILRFLQDRELTPLGSTRPRRMDVRIIAATNRTVAGTGQEAGGLRDDIVARLGAAPIHLPPLREPHRGPGRAGRTLPGGVPAQGPRFEQPAFRALCAARLAAERARAGEDRHHRGRADRGGKPIALRDLPEPIARVLSAPGRAGARAAPPARRRRRRSWRSCCAATRATSPTCRASSASTAPPSGAGSRSSASARRSSAASSSRWHRRCHRRQTRGRSADIIGQEGREP